MKSKGLPVNQKNNKFIQFDRVYNINMSTEWDSDAIELSIEAQSDKPIEIKDFKTDNCVSEDEFEKVMFGVNGHDEN